MEISPKNSAYALTGSAVAFWAAVVFLCVGCVSRAEITENPDGSITTSFEFEEGADNSPGERHGPSDGADAPRPNPYLSPLPRLLRDLARETHKLRRGETIDLDDLHHMSLRALRLSMRGEGEQDGGGENDGGEDAEDLDTLEIRSTLGHADGAFDEMEQATGGGGE